MRMLMQVGKVGSNTPVMQMSCSVRNGKGGKVYVVDVEVERLIDVTCEGDRIRSVSSYDDDDDEHVMWWK
jgi:hypothetical protein